MWDKFGAKKNTGWVRGRRYTQEDWLTWWTGGKPFSENQITRIRFSPPGVALALSLSHAFLFPFFLFFLGWVFAVQWK